MVDGIDYKMKTSRGGMYWMCLIGVVSTISDGEKNIALLILAEERRLTTLLWLLLSFTASGAAFYCNRIPRYSIMTSERLQATTGLVCYVISISNNGTTNRGK